MCCGVSILLEFRYLLYTTLRCDGDLQIFDPRKTETKNLDIYDERSYTKEEKKAGQLVPMVQVMRAKSWSVPEINPSRAFCHCNRLSLSFQVAVSLPDTNTYNLLRNVRSPM
jgi:hypothetical protein